MWKLVCSVEDLEKDSLHGFVIDSIPLLIVAQNEIRCFYDQCSHQDVKLSDFGSIQGDEILCFAHGAKFCLKTGSHTCPPATEGLKSFPIKVDNGQLFVSLS